MSGTHANTIDGVVAVWQRFVVDPLARQLPPWITPNRLTSVRLALAGALAVLLATQHIRWAAACYGIALLTDALDGAVARRRGRVTRFGSRFDPAVDKVLHGVLFVAFVRAAPALILLLLLVDGVLFVLGMLLLLRSHDVSAAAFGKWKFTAQALACLGVFWNSLVPMALIPPVLISVMFGCALVCAVLSVVGYVQRFALHAQPSVH